NAGTRSAYGLRIGANAVADAATNSATVQVGNGGGFGGLILNGNAKLAGGALTNNGTDEMDVWSGGAGTNTISSVVTLNGDLTTGGATLLDMQGTINLGGGARNITTTGNAATIISGTFNSGAGNSFTKRGGGTLIIGGTNTNFGGNGNTITVQ